MTNRNAYILMGLGAIILLTQMGGGIWIALVAAALLAGYVQRRAYGLLVAGSIFTGLAIGSVLELSWGWDGALLVSLGISFLVIDRIEPRENRWPRLVGRILIGLGIFVGLAMADLIGSVWVALALLGAGFFLLRRNGGGFSNPWVEVGPAEPTAKPVSTDTPAQTEPATAQPTVATTPVDTSLDLDDPEAVTMKTAAAAHEEDAPETTTEPVAQSSVSKPERDEALYAALETWRRDISKSEDRAAYLILTNASLEQIAQEKPQTEAELKDIKGIGPVKLERYAEAILSLTTEHS